MVRSVFFVLFLLPVTLMAQFGYGIDQTISVKDMNDNVMPMPWAGGINAVQYNTMDLNNDNKIDLVLFDRMANKVLTYLNTGGQYLYAPEYESLFPADATNWILLRDFNCDGKKDIFTGDPLGIKVYTNTTEPGGKLSWKQYLFFVEAHAPKATILLTEVGVGSNNSLINLQLQYDDLPSIIDADGDGDLDIFNMRYTGNSTAEFHQNLSIERYGTCDSLAFKRITQTWGNFTECGCGKFAFNGVDCSSLPGGRIEHAGGKSILMLDVDHDLDLDLIFSEASCTNLYLLKNVGTTQNPVINSSSIFPDINPVNFYIFPAAYYEDVDFDGISDLIATPNIYTKPNLNSDLAASNWFYKNTGTQQLPVLTFAKTNFLQDQMIDVGDSAIPAFADYDGDGDYDLFVSSNSSSDYKSKIFYFENIGSQAAPSFKLITNDFLGFSLHNFYNLKIQFAEVTGDKGIDLVFSATNFQGQQTNLYYIPNAATSSLNLSWQPIAVNFKMDYGDNICISDMAGNSDGTPDGKPDILVGRSTGALEYWQNTGSLSFELKNNGFLGLKSSVLRQNLASSVGDLDGDGTSDLILSDQSGLLTIISDFKKATDTSGGITDIILSPLQDSIYTVHNLGGRVWPTIVNLFKADKPAIVVGNILGGVQILKNTDGQYQSERPVIEMFPNPVEQSVTLNIKVDRNGYMQVFSVLGQQIKSPVLLKRNEAYSYSVNSLAKGIYLFQFTFNKQTSTRRIVIY